MNRKEFTKQYVDRRGGIDGLAEDEKEALVSLSKGDDDTIEEGTGNGILLHGVLEDLFRRVPKNIMKKVVYQSDGVAHRDIGRVFVDALRDSSAGNWS